ncbi:MAG: restriction endonuclease [Planctomycetes bacterium]|nr:restriction endonuclease [Planctomycetota bacterium]
MPILDFKEIPESNLPTGMQDTFELFARDYLEYLGYEIQSGPDRGQDGGRDIIAKEIRKGIGGESEIRWLVSCKHNAHSGRSVSAQDETNITDRVRSHGCGGFIGFYSTVPSSPLTRMIEGLKSELEVQILDNEKIEQSLLWSSEGIMIGRRYFPDSIQKWSQDNPARAHIFLEHKSLYCDYCHKDLLEPERSGIILLWHRYPRANEFDFSERRLIDVNWCCKGHCDHALESKYTDREMQDSWEDIPDLCMPTVYLRWVIGTLNELHYGDNYYTEEAYQKLRTFYISLFPYVSRGLTTTESERVQTLMTIPQAIGGLG